MLSMPEDCKDPDEVLTRHGPSDGATRLFRRCPPVTFEAAARLRVLSAETARAMPASSRPGYAASLAQALGLSVGALMEDWIRHAAETRARAVREHLRRWVSEWVGRLDRGSLGEHLDEATHVLAAARTDLSGPEMADVGDAGGQPISGTSKGSVFSSPGELAPTRAHQSPARPALGA
jgi:hypothetical protein